MGIQPNIICMTAAKKMKVRTPEKIRVLIADTDSLTARRTFEFLTQNGFDCRLSADGADAKKQLVSWRPRILLVDLLLPTTNAFEILKFTQTEPALKGHHVAVLVMSGHNNTQNVREAYERGARDFLARPIMFKDLLTRVVFHCREPREVQNNNNVQKDAMRLADLVVTQALQPMTFEEKLFGTTKMAALKVGALRCSIVQQLTYEKGVVLASNDKKDIGGLALDLTKYPEIQLTVNTGKTIVIDNLSESRALSRIRENFKDINFNSLVVCPLYYHQKPFGVISTRMPVNCTKVPDADIQFLEFVAKVLSLYLSTVEPRILGQYGLISA